ncbi:Crp/Fnr family transcriptional regulator [Mucilaginibacter terrae]|uniref:CRP/FNR family transcriptional regulator n=1 Tax=Mucilaginibacter terrae TaxID=1955052 RepID=A0ABU3GW38_9SPHI|nr:Crp/Fnr family transcriptional regulator [Mucilaginibacter terrae]MDT3403984.1 CRP/FNR family transcriptional regulator [Mucilaginibacter terrae]
MHPEFEAYLQQRTSLKPDEIKQVSSKAIARTLKRNEDMLQAGDVCRHKTFVQSGLLRTFGVTADGNEHILLFSPEETWTLDVESYDKQKPSKVNITAIEPSRVLLWHKPDFDALLIQVPGLKQLAEQLISSSTHFNRQRILTTLSGSAEEKYEDFLLSFPDLLNRLPLRMIAAYLGISLKTLTRIRHAQLQR